MADHAKTARRAIDPHSAATFAFAQLQREPSFRRRFSSLRNVYVCVESDLMDEVRRQATTHFPKGGSIACYYPSEQRFMFVRHGGLGELGPSEDEDTIKANDTAGRMTIGMVVDMITKASDWMDVGLGEVSTVEVEKHMSLS